MTKKTSQHQEQPLASIKKQGLGFADITTIRKLTWLWYL